MNFPGSSRFRTLTMRPMALLLSLFLLLLSLPLSAQSSGSFLYTSSAGFVTITGYTGPGGAVTIPATIQGMPVTRIGSLAFYLKGAITSVTIPNGVTLIDNYAFSSCSSLTLVNLPTGLTTIGIGAFTSCYSLSSVLFPDTLTSIGEGCFDDCANLGAVTIPVGVTEIGHQAFGNCPSLTSILVNPLNPAYQSSAGVLFNKAMTKLIQYPASRSGGYFQIPGTVTEIDSDAFRGSYVLTEIVVPAGVNTIGARAFAACTNLLDINVDESNSVFGSEQGVLYSADRTRLIRCPGGKNVPPEIPATVTSIEASAFAECMELTYITIPAGVGFLDDQAFSGCLNLQAATFRGNAPVMGNDVFSDTAAGFTIFFHDGSSGFTAPSWKGYHSVQLGDVIGTHLAAALDEPQLSVTTGGTGHWYRQTAMTHDGVAAAASGHIAGNGESWMQTTVTGSGILSFWWSVSSEANGDWLEFYLDGELTGTRISGTVGWTSQIFLLGTGTHTLRWRYSKNSTVDAGADTAWVDQLLWTPSEDGSEDFTYTSDGNSVTITGYLGAGGSVTIPPTISGMPVVSIAAGAFSNETGITGVSLPAGILSIGDGAFSGCVGLASLALPSGLASIGEQAFANCYVLPGIAIPASVTTIGSSAFSSCFTLEAITVDAANPAFSSLDGVLFDKNQTTLIQYPNGKYLAYTIPASVLVIGSEAFASAGHLGDLVLPPGLLTIGASAFRDCYDLTSISIPASVTTIGKSALSGCGDLQTIAVEAGNPHFTSIDGVLFDHAGTTLLQYPGGRSGAYVIPVGTIHIGPGAFAYCEGLVGITIPSSVISVGSEAFYQCQGLVSVVFPASVSEIGAYAFANCGSLAEATFLGNAPLIGLGIFSNTDIAFKLRHHAVATGFNSVQWLEYTVELLPHVVEPFGIESIVRNPGGTFTLTWPAPAGVTDPLQLTDVIHRSDTLGQWSPLVGATLAISGGKVTFTDSSPLAGRGFYRIGRH